jgi:acyl carrier protein
MPGELYVGGPGLARAYLGMPSETAEAFLPDPFATRPGCRMFRTGDRARWTAQGNIEFLGRVDGQLKIRGFRVERDEIETVIRSLPSVQSCAVTAYEPDPGNPMLVAYVVGRGARPSIPDLRRQVAERLPAHMAPARYVVLEQLPLTPLGKPDRRALPPPVFAADHEAAVPPRSDLERRIAAIWAAVLQVPEVGIHDNFFDLGGHSLLVTDLHARLEAALGRQFPIVDLFNHPTVAAIGARLAGSSDGADAQAAASDLASKRKAALERLSAKTRRGAAAGAAPAQQLGEP